MPCGICHFNGHNRLTCPLKESPCPQSRPTDQPGVLVGEAYTAMVVKERDDLMNECRVMGEQVMRLQNHINSLRRASLVCDMQLRKDLAETLFDKKTDIPDGIYLELMNKLRI